MHMYHYFNYFKKVFIPFSLFGCLIPVEASTYNLICTKDRSNLMRYKDKVSQDNSLTQSPSEYTEITNSGEKFEVYYDLKENSGFIENNAAKAIRVTYPKPYEYAPLFLYSRELVLNKNSNSVVLKTGSFNIRIENPTDSLSSFFFVESFLEEKEKTYEKNVSDQVFQGGMVMEKILEISEGFCEQIK